MILLHMSISGGVLILLTVAVRFLAAEKLPKRTFVMLWGITALRLLIPFAAHKITTRAFSLRKSVNVYKRSNLFLFYYRRPAYVQATVCRITLDFKRDSGLKILI